MERQRHRGLAEFVRDSGPGLLRTAVLLTGDRASAEDLVLGALSRARGRWPAVRSSGDPAAAVRELLVGEHLSRHRRLLRTEQVVEAVRPRADATASDGGYAQADALRTALLRLTPRARAAVVLHLAEGLDVATTAGLVRSEPGTVVDDVRGAVAALRPLLDPARPGAPEGDAEAEALGARLHALADELTWLDPTVPAEEVAARVRRRWRTRAAWAGAVGAAAALVVGVPAALGPAPAGEGTGTDPAAEPEAPARAAEVQAQLDDAVARIGAAPTLTSPAEWDQWLPRGRPPQGTTGQEDEGTCPPLSDRLTADLDAPMGYWTGALPRGPVGCTWVPSPAPLSAGGPYDYPYVLSVGFVHDRDGTSIETLRSTFAPGGPGARTLCPAADVPGGGTLIGCPGEDGRAGVRLLLAVRDARDAGVWVLSARAQPATGRPPAEVLTVLVRAVGESYG
ncbi:hypothetical protein [Trujillonella humicola]|uniref:hypothetical protein n=1 Tax=Trujillonella humicola TaxID=3383699 RepID=UPI00390651FE